MLPAMGTEDVGHLPCGTHPRRRRLRRDAQAHWAVQVAVKEPNEVAARDGFEGPGPVPRRGGDAGSLRASERGARTRDCFKANNTAYIEMGYEDGEPLDVLLRRHGTLTEAQLDRVLLPVVDGAAASSRGGPANVFVRRSDESSVLLGFGSARQALGLRSRSVTAIASAGCRHRSSTRATSGRVRGQTSTR